MRAAVRRAQTTQELRAYLTIGRPLLVLGTGIGDRDTCDRHVSSQASPISGSGWGTKVSVAAWLMNLGVAITMVKPAIGRVAAATASPDGQIGQRLDALRWSDRWSIGGDVLLANDAASL